eukprot:TRINITY_DN3372_c0_g1_i2.p1 TRINITY_DN3372_c0_g1~~TRINITY_DN3372_c0_g1_i2.p1  ORF type:complete len:291 (-),score=34.93 TRINITY_DN3372_c0_g1_i2:188-1060(-)
MPSAPLAFRATCGAFVPVFISFMLKRAIAKTAIRVAVLSLRTRADGVTLGLLLTYFFWGGWLLRCGDVERNPGPDGDKTTLKQTRLSASRLRATSDRTGSSTTSGQTTSSPPSPPEPSRADLMDMLQAMNSTMNCKFDDMDRRFEDLGEQFAALQTDVKNLREEVGVLRKDNLDLTKTNGDLLAKVEQLERKTDDLEGRSKRNNLIFYGVHRFQNETNDDCEGKIQDLLTDKLDMSREIEFDRVHRLSAKPDSPIIVRCTSYKDKVRILKEKKEIKRQRHFYRGRFFSPC